MFFMHAFLMFFIKVKKHVFYVFYSKINVFIIYEPNVALCCIWGLKISGDNFGCANGGV